MGMATPLFVCLPERKQGAFTLLVRFCAAGSRLVGYCADWPLPPSRPQLSQFVYKPHGFGHSCK